MKVLWVCNIMPPIVAEALHLESSNKEGWIAGLLQTILERQDRNGVELGIAFPVEKNLASYQEEVKGVVCYGFYEEVLKAEAYGKELEGRLKEILQNFAPDVIHCFGTEYGHTLAMTRVCTAPQRVLVGLQGLCTVCAQAYMADLPRKIQKQVTFRDWLKQDSIVQQQEKFALRGITEQEAVEKAGNVTGRTAFDRYYTKKWNPKASYYQLNETLRSNFYEGQWDPKNCKGHQILVSQGDYPLKGLHYVLLAMPLIKSRFADVSLVVTGNSIVAQKTLKDKIKLSAYGKYLLLLIQNLKLGEKVTFTGKLDADRMKQKLLDSGLFLCPSSLENSPNSLGEAMLLGMPCIAADVGGIPSLFTDGEDGILYHGFDSEKIEFCNSCYPYKKEEKTKDKKKETVESNKESDETEIAREWRKAKNIWKTVECSKEEKAIAENIAQAVCRMWENPKDQEQYCKNARKHAKSTHNREENYERLMEIYAEISNK